MGTRTERFLQLQNLRAHYKNMLNVEPTYVLNRTVQKSPEKAVHNIYGNRNTKKSEKERQIQIIDNNFHLLSNLNSINKRPERYLCTKSFKNIHSSSEERKWQGGNPAYWAEVVRENYALMKRLGSIQPTIISKSEWKRHYKTHREQLRRLSKKHIVGQSRQEKIVKQSIDTLKSELIKQKRAHSAKFRPINLSFDKSIARHSQKSTHNGASVYDQVEEDCIRQLKQKEIYGQS